MEWDPKHQQVFRHCYGGRRVCVTGGAGFIGGHLASALLDLGAEVVVLDDLSNSDADRVGRLIDRYPRHCRFVHGSILDPSALGEAVRGSEIVFHLAAMGSVSLSIREPERCMAVNLTGTLRVAEAARDAGVSRWVFSASSSAYGESEQLPKVETQMPQPVSPYAASKVAAEFVVRAWAVSYGLPGISLRYFNVFGPHQAADSAYAAVIAAFATALLRGESPVIYGDGLQSRDFTPVADAVYANLLAGSTRRDLRGEVVNVGTGRRTTLLELLAMLKTLTGTEHIEPRFQAPRDGDVRHSQADLARAGEVLGYRPIKSLDIGLTETVEWFARNAASR